MTESRPDPRPPARVQKALDRLHRWDEAMGWGAFNAIVHELDAAWAEARSSHSDVSAAPSKDDTLRAALEQARDDFESIFGVIHPGEMTDDEMHRIAQTAYFGQEHAERALAAADPTPKETL